MYTTINRYAFAGPCYKHQKIVTFKYKTTSKQILIEEDDSLPSLKQRVAASFGIRPSGLHFADIEPRNVLWADLIFTREDLLVVQPMSVRNEPLGPARMVPDTVECFIDYYQLTVDECTDPTQVQWFSPPPSQISLILDGQVLHTIPVKDGTTFVSMGAVLQKVSEESQIDLRDSFDSLTEHVSYCLHNLTLYREFLKGEYRVQGGADNKVYLIRVE